MRRWFLNILFMGIAAYWLISASSAKVYWLPDYLQSNLDRVNSPSDNNGGTVSPGGGGNDDRSCSTWGMLSWEQISARGLSSEDCDRHSFPQVGICYDNCKCPARFQYTSSNCSDDKIPSGASCDGEYETCSCNTSRFPYTSCPSGYVPGGEACNDGSTHYSECINPCDTLTDHDCGAFECQKTYADCSSKCEVCYTDNCHLREDNSNSFGCQKYWDDCSTKCETPYQDNCHNRTDNQTDYGCQKYWQDCPSKCEVGKTCTPTDCSGFNLTSVPANASYETCSPGCGDSSKRYRITQCNAGYWDLNNFLCSGNQLCTWKIN